MVKLHNSYVKIYLATLSGLGHTKTCLMPDANNKGADQPVHPRSLISTFVVRCLNSTICILAISKSFKILAIFSPAPIAQLVECPLWGTGGHGFDPGPRHTKVIKYGTSCSSLGTQT